MVSISQLQEIPTRNMILLVAPPSAGKSTFCEQTILQSVAADTPIIYVTTTCDPSKVERALKERGLREVEPDILYFVDAYNETVGISVLERPQLGSDIQTHAVGHATGFSQLTNERYTRWP